MKIIHIFDDANYLLTVIYENEKSDEFTRIFDNWTDIGWLEDFFTKNEKDLFRTFWQPMTIKNAVVKTRNDAIQLRKHFINLLDKSPEERISEFNQLFKPLQKQLSDEKFLYMKKVYGARGRSWIRIYALKVSDDIYVITGGTIKLTDNMEEREHTLRELKKLESCKWFLKEQGIIDDDGIIELLES